jgi:uncharacterized membrane protein YdjX (TVP38/TMEM64 family)
VKRPPSWAPGRRSALLRLALLGLGVALAAAVVVRAAIAFPIGRSIAPDAVEQLAGPRLQAIEALIRRRGFLSVLYARIAPGVPYTLVNYAAGLTRIPLAVFMAATALGAAPRAFAYTALGGSLGDLRSPEAAVAAAVLVVVGWRAWCCSPASARLVSDPFLRQVPCVSARCISATARSSRADSLPAPTQA